MDAAVFRVTEGKSREGEGMDTPGRGRGGTAEIRKDSPCSVQELGSDPGGNGGTSLQDLLRRRGLPSQPHRAR